MNSSFCVRWLRLIEIGDNIVASAKAGVIPTLLDTLSGIFSARMMLASHAHDPDRAPNLLKARINWIRSMNTIRSRKGPPDFQSLTHFIIKKLAKHAEGPLSCTSDHTVERNCEHKATPLT